MNIDTVKVKKCGEDVVMLSRELNQSIQTLYSKIYNMPFLTGEWVGDSAELFARQANLVEKKDAIDVANTLKKFGELLIRSAEKYERELQK